MVVGLRQRGSHNYALVAFIAFAGWGWWKINFAVCCLSAGATKEDTI
jgi:hypothetical protein